MGVKKGYKQTEDHKRKIGEANKRGRIIKCLYCKKEFWIQPWEEKRNPPRKYCNRECFKKYYTLFFVQRGEENPFWDGGAYSYWKRQTLIRDDYTCQICGLKDKEIMMVDHIKERNERPDLIKNIDNLQSLCPNCHRRKTNRYMKELFTKRVRGK